ncbi:hypothetical protein Tco_0996912, partial [Tanacetum coccineum]
SDLNAQLQEKVFAITALKNDLRKLKRKNVVDIVVSKPNATIAPGMFKLDMSHPAKAETRGVTSWISSQYNGVNNREN